MEAKPCKECPDNIERHICDGKAYVLVEDIYVSFYTMALLLFSDVPDVKERLDRAIGPIPGASPTRMLEVANQPLSGGLDAEMRVAMKEAEMRKGMR